MGIQKEEHVLSVEGIMKEGNIGTEEEVEGSRQKKWQESRDLEAES